MSEENKWLLLATIVGIIFVTIVVFATKEKYTVLNTQEMQCYNMYRFEHRELGLCMQRIKEGNSVFPTKRHV